MDALAAGAKLTYIDPRVSITATKAHRYWMIRPGTDLALNYALMHVILKERLYDAALRGEVGARPERAAGFRAGLHAGVGRKGNRHPGSRNRGPGAGNEQGQAVRHFPLRLPRGPSRQRNLPAPVHPDPERPHGQHRGQGRASSSRRVPARSAASRPAS